MQAESFFIIHHQNPLLERSAASPSTLLLSSPGFWGTPFDILIAVLNVPIKINCFVTQMHAPPFY